MSNITKLIILTIIGLILAGISIYLIGGKRQDYDAEVTIKAPVGQIFPYAVKPELKQLWMKGLDDQALTEGDAIEEGVFLKSTRVLGGVSEQFDDEVIRFQENEIISIKSRNKRLSSTTMLKFKEIGNGTKVTFKRVVKFNGIDRFKTVFADAPFQQELEKDLDELAKLIESNVSDSGSSDTSN